MALSNTQKVHIYRTLKGNEIHTVEFTEVRMCNNDVQ